MNDEQIIKKLSDIFNETFDISEFKLSLTMDEVPEWDSIAHMTLMSGLEEGFGITLETDDIVDFSSYKNGIEIL